MKGFDLHPTKNERLLANDRDKPTDLYYEVVRRADTKRQDMDIEIRKGSIAVRRKESGSWQEADRYELHEVSEEKLAEAVRGDDE